ncbi:B3 domain-containing protein At2g31720-like [Dillenia turbinata]|uniref:B3 domain-containing protein At2g31720-like n=1 Tax=Dillenia turbinata TaxID=194707 RepID=A0AAN8Z5U2_9MAGN
MPSKEEDYLHKEKALKRPMSENYVSESEWSSDSSSGSICTRMERAELKKKKKKKTQEAKLMSSAISSANADSKNLGCQEVTSKTSLEEEFFALNQGWQKKGFVDKYERMATRRYLHEIDKILGYVPNDSVMKQKKNERTNKRSKISPSAPRRDVKIATNRHDKVSSFTPNDDDKTTTRHDKISDFAPDDSVKTIKRQERILNFTSDHDAKTTKRQRENRLESVKQIPNLSLKKRRKVSRGNGLDPPPDLPEEFKNRIEELGGTTVTLVIQKRLFESVLKKQLNRFSIPLSQVKTEFLREDEKMKLQKSGGEINVMLIALDPSKEPIEVTFKKWDMRKDSGKVSSLYVLNNTWMRVVNENALEEGDLVQLWSFRNPSADLQFAFVRVVADHDVPVMHEE